MSTKVSKAERILIEQLLEEGIRPYDVGQIVGRGERTVFYIQAELRRKQVPSLRSRIIRFLKGETNAEKGIDTRRVGENRRA